jgi:hypothetical protein
MLSLVVTLVAMVVKEWCYVLMTGRTGTMYEQARKRQWRFGALGSEMPGLITLLPTLMHAALCEYLWG